MKEEFVHISKYLSYVLRHAPESIGLTLDSEGWASIEQLIALAAQHGRQMTRHAIEAVVATNEKKRFALSPDGTRIRAVQGHSTPSVAIQFEEKVPPAVLYHGTATRFVPSILEQGLLPGTRQHVHLSDNLQTAVSVGQRHGRPVVLSVAAGELHAQGGKFYLSENNVWLAEHVPASYLSQPGNTDDNSIYAVVEHADVSDPTQAPSRQIRALFDDTTIRVYQAYSDVIADSAMTRGTLVSPPFKMERMTWIKPSFLWMMYRSGWGLKDAGQNRILAFDISRSGLEWALANACASHPPHGKSTQDWEALKDRSPVRIQWDPERDLHHNALDHRAIQIGLSGEAVRRYVHEWIQRVTDVTPLVHAIHALVRAGDLAAATAMLPPERLYP